MKRKEIINSFIYAFGLSLAAGVIFALIWIYLNAGEKPGIYVEIPPDLREGLEITYNIPFIYFTRYYPMKKEAVTYTLEENSLLRKENISGLLTSTKYPLKIKADYALPADYKFQPIKVVSPTLYLKTLKIYGPRNLARKYMDGLTAKITHQLFSLLKIKSYYARTHIQNLLYLRTRIERKIQELKGKIIFLEEVGRKYGNREGPNLATSVEPYFLAYLSPTLQARASSIIIHELETDSTLIQKEVEYFTKYSKFYWNIQKLNSCEEAESRAKKLFPITQQARLMGELERDCLLARIFSVSIPMPQKRKSISSIIYVTLVAFFFFLSLFLLWFTLKHEE